MSANMSILVVFAIPALLVGGCQQGSPESGAAIAVTALPLEGVTDPYEAAARQKLEDRKPEEWDDLHNVYRLSDRIISGSEPHGDAALERISEMGVRTVISVDGKTPDHEAAARFGLRYVHIPIQYKSITEDELLRLTKTFRELDPPFYVHCFHGKHRGPAAAAVGRLVIDSAPREQALAEMRQWCGTGKKYPGLYEAIATAEVPAPEVTAAYAFGFPAALPLEGFRHAMIEMSRVFDHVELLAKREFEIDPAHPDLDPVNEGTKLSHILAEGAKLPEVKARPTDFRDWMEASNEEGERLVGALKRLKGGDPTGRAEALEAFREIDKSCNACHLKYRNR